ncbi:hypothetical protein DYB30_013322, partial [Aphanomyces astaci]
EGIKQAKMYQFPSDQLDLYRVEGLVQGHDGQFLLNGNPIDLTRASLDSFGGHKANMPAASLISECFDTTSAPLARKIHVVVARLDDFPNTSYKRWTKLDAAMDQYKSWHGGVYGAPLADVSWSDVGWVFDKCTSHQELPREVIAPDHMGTTDSMENAMAQVLLGCEAVADEDMVDVVYGIATNGVKWMFFKRESTEILKMEVEIQVGDDHRPTLESLQRVVETIHAMFVSQ